MQGKQKSKCNVFFSFLCSQNDFFLNFGIDTFVKSYVDVNINKTSFQENTSTPCNATATTGTTTKATTANTAATTTPNIEPRPPLTLPPKFLVNPSMFQRNTNNRFFTGNPTIDNGALGFVAGFAGSALLNNALGSNCG